MGRTRHWLLWGHGSRCTDIELLLLLLLLHILLLLLLQLQLQLIRVRRIVELGRWRWSKPSVIGLMWGLVESGRWGYVQSILASSFLVLLVPFPRVLYMGIPTIIVTTTAATTCPQLCLSVRRVLELV